MKKIHTIIFCFISLYCYSSNYNLFNKANENYSSGKYQEALNLYENIEKKDDHIYYNIGNCYYKLQDWSNAILHYEKSLQINKTNIDAQYNLKLTNLKIVDRIEKLPELFYKKWWNSIINLYTIKTWQLFSIIMTWLFLLIFILKKYIKTNTILSQQIVFSIAVFMLLITQNSHKQNQTDYAILFKNVDIVKSAPSQEGTELFSIHSGTKMEIIDQIGDWINIELQNGKSGWILLSNVKEI